jgi:uncharacterized membrane-anchored protein
MKGRTLRVAVASLAALVILLWVNLEILDRERLLTEGRVIYLELAPVDPRSLMQGDYMALDFAVARSLRTALSNEPGPGDGLMVARLDERNVASFSRIDRGEPLGASEIRLKFHIRNERVRFATDAWFFEEGTARAYEGARYGQFRVDDSGDLMLTALADGELQILGSPSS